MSFKLDGTKFKAWTDGGAPLVGGLLYTYVSGTTTPKATYTSATLGSANTNPIVLDARGEADVWLGTGAYTFVLKTAAAVTIDTVDGVESAATLSDLAGSSSQLRADLASTASASVGLGLSGFDWSVVYAANTGGWALRSRQNEVDFLRYVPVAQWAAILAGTSTFDCASALSSAVAAGVPVRLPAGRVQFSAAPNLGVNGLTLLGAGSSRTVLKYTGSGIALDLDGTVGAAGFKQNITIGGFSIEGTSAAQTLVRLRRIARSTLFDLNAREADNSTGVAFLLQAAVSCVFDRLTCSQDLQSMTSAPSECLQIQANIGDGNSANNVFIKAQFDGAGAAASNTINVGIRISGGTQNLFLGGASQSMKTWGLLIGSTCQNNTFDTFGMENLNAVGGDFSDGGNSNAFVNCYASQKAVFQGRAGRIDGGNYERIQIDSGALKNRIRNCTVNGWATGAGGFFDSGTGTQWDSIWDEDASAFIYPTKARTGLSLPASGGTFTNTTGQCIEVIINGGSVSSIVQGRGADTWAKPAASPTSHILSPNDTLVVTYAVAPTGVWAIYHNGLNG